MSTDTTRNVSPTQPRSLSRAKAKAPARGESLRVGGSAAEVVFDGQPFEDTLEIEVPEALTGDE